MGIRRREQVGVKPAQHLCPCWGCHTAFCLLAPSYPPKPLPLHLFIPRSPLLLLIPGYLFVFQFPYVFLSKLSPQTPPPQTSPVFCFSPFASLAFCPLSTHTHTHISPVFFLPHRRVPSLRLAVRGNQRQAVRRRGYEVRRGEEVRQRLNGAERTLLGPH